MRLPFQMPRMQIRNPFRRRDTERPGAGEAVGAAGQGNTQATPSRGAGIGTAVPSTATRPATPGAETPPPEYSPVPSFRGMALRPGEIRVHTNFSGVPIGIGDALDYGAGFPLQFRPRRPSEDSTTAVSHLDLDATGSSAESPTSPIDVGRILGNPYIANATPVPSRQASLSRGPHDASFSALDAAVLPSVPEHPRAPTPYPRGGRVREASEPPSPSSMTSSQLEAYLETLPPLESLPTPPRSRPPAGEGPALPA